MPRFRVTASFDLLRFLADLGLTRIDGIIEDRRLAISDAVHRCVLRVDEDGIEGAAVTAVAMVAATMIATPPRPVTIDRPFLLMVTHTPTGAIYFMARVGDVS
jgi:serpin B